MDTALLLSGVAKTLESSAPSYSRSKCALAQQFLGPKFRKQREAYAHALPGEMFSHVVLVRAKENRTQIVPTILWQKFAPWAHGEPQNSTLAQGKMTLTTGNKRTAWAVLFKKGIGQLRIMASLGITRHHLRSRRVPI